MLGEDKATSRDLADLRQYLSEIGRYPLLTAQEEQDLAHRIAQHDVAARDTMIRSNLRLVVAIAKHYADRGMPLQDLIAEGNLGLLKAVTRFSPAQGCRFSTYAAWWIKQTIRRALTDKVDAIRVPAYMTELMHLWRRTASELAQVAAREPSFEEINEVLRLPRRRAVGLKRALAATGGYGQSKAQDKDVAFEEILASIPAREESDQPYVRFDTERLKTAMQNVLSEKEREVLELRFGLEGRDAHTLRQIADRLGLTRERVRQITTAALQRIKTFFSRAEERESLARETRTTNRLSAPKSERALQPIHETSVHIAQTRDLPKQESPKKQQAQAKPEAPPKRRSRQRTERRAAARLHAGVLPRRKRNGKEERVEHAAKRVRAPSGRKKRCR